MDDKLLYYYEQELTFIRQMGVEFAKKYPKVAGRLLLENDKCDDPHTERLIEAFAFLSGRIRKKIDDDFPEITEALLNVIYPHYINPIPSMSVVKFAPVQKNISELGYPIDKNTQIFTKPVNGTPCQFTTCYPVMLWPLEVVSAELQEPETLVEGAVQVIVVKLKSLNNLTFSQLGWKKLRFFLNGPHQHVFHLHELLFNNVCHVECETTNQQGNKIRVKLTPDEITSVGFGADDGILPCSSRSFPGYMLLFEYFCFPEKFLFFELNGLGRIKDMKFGSTMSICFYLNRAAVSNLVVDKDTFCLNATPAINLFNRIAEPIRVEHLKTEYRVIPNIRRQESTEVYSIDKVTATAASSPGKEVEFRPFYSLRHHIDSDDGQGLRAYWHSQRRHSGKKGDEGTEVFLSFTDLDFTLVDPEAEILTIHTTCTNRDLPTLLSFGDTGGDFYMETAAPVDHIKCLVKPTPVRRPTLGGTLQWRLISHLSLNYLSLIDSSGDSLKEILKLYDFDNSPSTRQQINGIVSLNPQYITRRIGQSFCRGVRVTVEFDEKKYVGSSIYLFACVLERFLGQYVSVNSFSQLVAKTIQKREVLKEWAPRSGNQVLL